MDESLETAVLGGGCFWCLDAVYRRVAGVKSVISGYAGGNTENPDYESVCRGNTGHAEVVMINFDPSEISYENILEVFWEIHDPTTLNRQGAEMGSQYRSVIYYVTNEQEKTARNSKKGLEESGKYRDPVVTQIEPFDVFYEAEDYHQNYYNMNRMANPYCMAVIDPKVKKFIKGFGDYLKEPGGGF